MKVADEAAIEVEFEVTIGVIGGDPPEKTVKTNCEHETDSKSWLCTLRSDSIHRVLETDTPDFR